MSCHRATGNRTVDDLMFVIISRFPPQQKVLSGRQRYCQEMMTGWIWKQARGRVLSSHREDTWEVYPEHEIPRKFLKERQNPAAGQEDSGLYPKPPPLLRNEGGLSCWITHSSPSFRLPAERGQRGKAGKGVIIKKQKLRSTSKIVTIIVKKY